MLDVSHDSDVTSVRDVRSPPRRDCRRKQQAHMSPCGPVTRFSSPGASARAEYRLQIIALRKAGTSLHLALRILEQDAGRTLEAHLHHQHLVGIQFGCDVPALSLIHI